MNRTDFEKIVSEGIDEIPERFRKRIKNVAFLVEDEPSEEIRLRENLKPNETLFGLYTGIPLTERGEFYGVGPVLPDTITIYQRPIEDEAYGDPKQVRRLVIDTVWHEVAHYLGLNEEEVRKREEERGVK